MAIKTLGAKAAAALDQELMSTGAFSIDQLMELAGLSVSQAANVFGCGVEPADQWARQCIVFNPQEMARGSLWLADRETMVDLTSGIDTALTDRHRVGGDGLVAARHLRHYGYQTTVFYPKRSKNDLYQRLAKQLEDLDVPFVDDFLSAMKSTDHIVDAIFGFSFSGEVRDPFPAVIQGLQETKLPVTSVDAPSSWDIENGPPKSGLGSSFMPTALVSLTAPKPLVKHFKGRHFIGGRFVSPSIAKKYDLEVPEYVGVDQIVEVGSTGQKL
ncbi:hypothetical protein QQZ08_000128 [Neonectria magnoliae]|uniref:NAD(P)H-hydrate epimerase n=1 Tax=Neonectria magnoliae TaxID=2732573 RepID=A0ABR1IHZ4_9HYPO